MEAAPGQVLLVKYRGDLALPYYPSVMGIAEYQRALVIKMSCGNGYYGGPLRGARLLT